MKAVDIIWETDGADVTNRMNAILFGADRGLLPVFL